MNVLRPFWASELSDLCAFQAFVPFEVNFIKQILKFLMVLPANPFNVLPDYVGMLQAGLGESEAAAISLTRKKNFFSFFFMTAKI